MLLLLPVLAVATLFCFETTASELRPSDVASVAGKTGSRNDNIQGESQNIPSKQPVPYTFGYRIQDKHGNVQARQEEVDPDGRAVGSYSFMDSNGIFRRVEYIADANGFRAIVNTNEPGTSGINPAHVLISREETPPTVQQEGIPKSAKKPTSHIASSPYVKSSDENKNLPNEQSNRDPSANRLHSFYSGDRTFLPKSPGMKINLTGQGQIRLYPHRNPTYSTYGTAPSKLLEDVSLEDLYKMPPRTKPMEDVLTEDLYKVPIQSKLLKDGLPKDIYESAPLSRLLNIGVAKKQPQAAKPGTYSSESVSSSGGPSGDDRDNSNKQGSEELGVHYSSDISLDKSKDYHTSYSSTGSVRNRQPERPHWNKDPRKSKVTSRPRNGYKFRRRTTPKPKIHIPAGVEDSDDLPLYKDK